MLPLLVALSHIPEELIPHFIKSRHLYEDGGWRKAMNGVQRHLEWIAKRKAE
ncbi:hypothetical protein [Pseudomonas poae]|uniref:hypothetical protein n=1 Tax=Pseudomonas poae TaxID=200451 RepID=UPI0034D5C00C